MKIWRTPKTEIILSLILRFNLRLGGYSIWSASTSRNISEEEIQGQENLIALMQPGKYSEDYSRRSKDSKTEQWISEALEGTQWTPSEVLNTCMTRLRRAQGLVGPRTMGLPTGTEYSRVGSSTWICPTSFCIYLNRSRTSLHTRELAKSLRLGS